MLLPSPSCHAALLIYCKPALCISRLLHHTFAAPQSAQDFAGVGLEQTCNEARPRE